MGVSVVHNGKNNVPETVKRHDAKLVCETCRLVTLHRFIERIKIAYKLFDVVYECSRCNTHRVWGRESDKPIDNSDDEG